MTYLLTSQTSVQAVNSDQSVQNLFKINNSAVEVDSTLLFTPRVLAGVAFQVGLTGVSKLQVVAAKGIVPFDISLKAVGGIDVYTGCPSTTFLIVNPVGFVFDHLKVLSFSQSLIEITIGGLY